MSNNFDLLQGLLKLKDLGELLDKSNKLSLEQLKSNADQYLKLRNTVANEIWLLKLKIKKSTSNSERLSLSAEITELKEKFAACKSEEEIINLIAEIRNRELSENGSSDIRDNSPYTLISVI